MDDCHSEDILFDFDYADDLDALRELEEDGEFIENYDVIPTKAPPSKKSLSFTSVTENKNDQSLNSSKNVDQESESRKRKVDGDNLSQNESRKRNQSEVFISPTDKEGLSGTVSKKRRTDELCNDMNPSAVVGANKNVSSLDVSGIENFEITPPSSPKADENSKQLTVLEKKSILNETGNISKETKIPDEASLVNTRASSRRIPVGDFLSVTGTDGKRVYVGVKSDEDIKRAIAKSCTSSQSCFQLLGIPMAVLKVQAEEDRQAREIRDTRRATSYLEAQQMELVINNDESLASTAGHLWVDRYSPQRYTDLLSDESTNRNLLRWLKMWDFTVFGKQSKLPGAANESKKKKNEAPQFNNKPQQADLLEQFDQFKRPMFKVALVSGPPGLGKTTLAHIIAKHAGYNVVEMNASDDRSAEVFKEKIEGATQMKAVLGADPRPNCLIIDEIDGAPQPAINVLLSVIKKTDPTTGSTNKKKKDVFLQRPIICICNDLYVPALRQLRLLSYLVTFYSTTSARLASRLLEISRNECLKTDLTTLMALCEKADNDIRSCINTLQFVKADRGELSLHSVHSLSLGQKDAHRTLLSVWQHIFTMPKPSRKRYVNPYDRADVAVDQVEELNALMAENNTSPSARFHNTLQMVQAAGDDGKIQQGLFDNYLESKAKDSRLGLLLKATDWLCYVDVINQIIGHSQDYSLMRYLPFLPVAFHLLFAVNQPHKIVFPHSHFEFQTNLTKLQNLITTLVTDVVPSVRSNLNTNIVVMELLPFLTDIIQPNLRPVNSQLFSVREKEELAQLIRIMIAYNLTYQQERTAEGQYTYNLEPNVEQLVRFPDVKQTRQLTYNNKQLVAREIELEKLRKNESVQFQNSSSSKPEKPLDPLINASESLTSDSLPNYQRQKLEPKAIKELKPAVDFFGRKIQKTANETIEIESKKDEIGGDIWFRFKEGYSNAVRKTVRVQDLK